MPQRRLTPVERRRFRPPQRRSSLPLIFLVSAFATHAIGSFASGSLDPARWDKLLFWTCVLFVAPLLALAIAIADGAFDGPGG